MCLQVIHHQSCAVIGCVFAGSGRQEAPGHQNECFNRTWPSEGQSHLCWVQLRLLLLGQSRTGACARWANSSMYSSCLPKGSLSSSILSVWLLVLQLNSNVGLRKKVEGPRNWRKWDFNLFFDCKEMHTTHSATVSLKLAVRISVRFWCHNYIILSRSYADGRGAAENTEWCLLRPARADQSE